MADYSTYHRSFFKVRDYECDMQGRVNNSVYGNYFEHARHEALLAKDIDFAKLCEEGVHLVVTRLEVDYRQSLGSRDWFVVCTNIYLQGRLKLVFQQDLLLLEEKDIAVNDVVVSDMAVSDTTVKDTVVSGGVLYASARVTGVALSEKGRPFVPSFFSHLS